jgi:hypothetical protein
VAARYADVVALIDEPADLGIQRLVLESTSDYWRIWHVAAAHGAWHPPVPL